MQLPLFADITPNGSGFTITPRKPTFEVTVPQAAKILGMSRGHFWYILNMTAAGKLIHWRRLSPCPTSRRLIDVASLEAYRQLTIKYVEDN